MIFRKTIFIKPAFLFLCTTLLIACAEKTETVDDKNKTNKRIVSVGGAVTETIYALSAEDQIVGTDSSSFYPAEAAKLPQVGYQRTLSAEGVLSLKPDLLLAVPEVGPPPALSQIETAGVKIVKVNGENTIEGAKTKIREIAEAVGKTEKGAELIEKLDADMTKAKQCADGLLTKPKVLFIYSRGTGAPQVGGLKTPADEMIKLAGGENAVTDFENYKPLTPESLVAISPDVILLPTRGLKTIGGIDAVLKLPGIADTPAGRNRRIIDVDDVLLLSFSPRIGEGILELCGKLR
jgi:iron complex transport system substrate-binding protein